MKNTHPLGRRLAAVAAGGALALVAVGVQTVTASPADATPLPQVHAGQTFCNSSNSSGTLEMQNLDTAGGLYPGRYRIARGTCVDVASRDAYRLRLVVDFGYCMRVGYDRKPYRGWQWDADGHRDFRPADNDLIWFDIRGAYVCA